MRSMRSNRSSRSRLVDNRFETEYQYYKFEFREPLDLIQIKLPQAALDEPEMVSCVK